jgi:Ni/Co efflux regulator RcnB
MNKSMLAAATALMLLGAAAGTASADPGKNRGHKGAPQARGHSDERSHHDRDCDGIANGRDHDRQNNKDKDCDGIANRFDHHDGRDHAARRSYAGPRYIAPRDYRYARYDSGSRLPQGYWGDGYYVNYQTYGLPPPQDGYRWNRVGNDVYMVDVRNGLIAEAVYSIFH